MTKPIEDRIRESFKYGGNSLYLEELYEKYITNPEEIAQEWRSYFDSIANGQKEINHSSVKEKYKNFIPKRIPTNSEITVLESPKSSEVQNFVNAFRRRGHEIANIDPLNLRKQKSISDLELSFHNLSEADLETSFSLSNFQKGKAIKLKDIKASIQNTYASKIGYEFMHIGGSKIRKWFLDKIEGKPTP